MTAVAGLRGTGDWSTDERPKNFRELILWRNPNGSAPIFALTAKVQKETTDDAEFSWWDEPNDLVRLQANGSHTSAVTTITVDSGDPGSTDATKDNRWGLAKHLVPGDLLMVEPTADNATYDHEIMEVATVISDTQFTVTRGVSGTTAATIADNVFLLKIGNRFEEGSAHADSATRNPVKYYNYTQIFKTVYEVSGTAAQTRLRTGDPLANERKRKMFDHSRDIEMALLYGQRDETTGANGKPLRTFGGLRANIPSKTTTILGTSTRDTDNFMLAVYKVFDFDSPAGDTRIAFAGNEALLNLNRYIKADTATTIHFSETVPKVYGMQFQELILPQGRLLIKRHPLLSRNTLYAQSMFIIDFSALRYRPFKKRDTKFQDNIQLPGEDVIRGQWMTEAGFEVRAGGLTCGYIGGIAAPS